MTLFRTSLSLVLVSGLAAGGCDLIEAASSDRPNGTQRSAMGDIFEGVGGFISVVSDPMSASDDDFADMHRTEPLAKILDPDGVSISPRLTTGGPSHVNPTGCIISEGSTASWDCDFVSPVLGTCTAIGSGTENADGTYSGSSSQCCPALPRDENGASMGTCADAGGVETAIEASNLVFDEVSGTGGGSLSVRVADHGAGASLSDLATVTLSNIGFCTGEAVVAPDSGTMTVDGLGVLEGRPFDPLTIKFTDTPECGVALIE